MEHKLTSTLSLSNSSLLSFGAYTDSIIFIKVMGIVRTEESRKLELEELRRMLVACAGIQRRKDQEEFKGVRVSSKENKDDILEKLVCVTSGVSYLGLAIVNKLLLRGYSVRIIVENEGNFCYQT